MTSKRIRTAAATLGSLGGKAKWAALTAEERRLLATERGRNGGKARWDALTERERKAWAARMMKLRKRKKGKKNASTSGR